MQQYVAAMDSPGGAMDGPTGRPTRLPAWVVGVAGCTKTGPGMLTLAGNNSYSSAFTIAEGPVLAQSATAFGNLFIVDRFSQFTKLLTLGAAGPSILLSLNFIEREYMARFEFPVLILLATIGMMLMISANNLIALYMGLELQSLSLYVLAAINRDAARASPKDEDRNHRWRGRWRMLCACVTTARLRHRCWEFGPT